MPLCKIVWILICSVCLTFALKGEESAHNYYFTSIGGEQGLSHNNVKAITQDSRGFMWIGTRNRLNRYDGKAIKVYDCYDPVREKRNNNIGALMEDFDSLLWVGTDKGVFRYNSHDESFSYMDMKTAEGIEMEDWIADIQKDKAGNMWIVVPKQGVFRYNSKEDKLYYYKVSEYSQPNEGNPQSICIEPGSGKVWIGTNGVGVYLYNPLTDSFQHYLGDTQGDSLIGEFIFTMCDYGEYLILGMHEGKLRKLHKTENAVSDVNAPSVHYKIIRDLETISNKIWVGTQAGIYVIDELNDEVIHVHEDPMFKYTLSDNIIEKIYLDKENSLWIGTMLGGVGFLPNRGMTFEQYVPLHYSNSISSRRFRKLTEDKAGNIWIGTDDEGIDIFNPYTQTFTNLKNWAPLLWDNLIVLEIMLDGDSAWVGFFKNGLDIVDLKTNRKQHYAMEDLGIDESSVYSLYKDSEGTIWLGNGWGIYTKKKDERKFIRQNAFELSYIYDILEDRKGYIWVATMGNGVFRYDRRTDETIHFLNDIYDEHSLSSNSVSSITEDRQGNIWFSTDRGGICCYNYATDDFISYSVKDGLPDDVAYKILEDKRANLWFGTNKGLVKFNPLSKDIQVFTQKDGLATDQFAYKAALVAQSGKFYFGASHGLIGFDPYSFHKNEFVPPVYITRLSLFNKEVDAQTKDSPLTQSISHTRKIVLPHNQSNISFDFAALSYISPQANEYAYQMEGIDESWTYTTMNQSASYAKLPPGSYTFHVKGSNNDGVWSEQGASLQIVILPPWWQSSWAYTLYTLAIIGLIFLWFHWYKRKNERKAAIRQHLFETEKEKELYEAKVRFFTDIAHEIRTPITLINGPLESMQEMKIEDPVINKNLRIMSKNTNRLLRLINQLLDFRKLDSNKIVLNMVETDISELVKDVTMQFEPLAERKGKHFELSLPREAIRAWIDSEEFIKILNNLFSNALKYSNKQIEVELSGQSEKFTLRVSNDGDLIPDDFLEKVFEPFYQLKKDRSTAASSGIGLSLVRSLTELHTGSISVNTQNGINNFVLEIPLEQPEAIKTEEENLSEEIVEDVFVADKDIADIHETVLLVEDNAEMLSFLTERLSKFFFVEKAASGKEALDILPEKNIDIIVSDVMMPGMDGFEFCSRVKSDLEYSHIPIVLLTAKNDLSSKIKGLEIGAEAYVEKPFSFHYLITQLTTLLNNRRREREAFIQKPFIPVQQMGMNKADERFMDKVIEIIHQNMADPSFNVEKLAEYVHMSRSSLHRKIKGLLELPPNDFIRLVRLKKAAEIIQTENVRIGEVCYMVGITSPSYFIKQFQKQFGMTPKEFEKQQRNS